MNVLIIEDERRAANRLRKLIRKVDPAISIVGATESVKATISFLNSAETVDLIFSDIQLTDGLSFEIFDQIELDCPIIFTTAYDQYAIDAFKTNGIDYLLKPIAKEDLNKAIKKFRKFSVPVIPDNLLFIAQAFLKKNDKHKSRFMVKVGEHIKSVPIEEISHFSSEYKATFLHTVDSRKCIVDYSLEQLIDVLKPDTFFRISRKYIIAIDSIGDIVSYSNSRLKIKSKYSSEEDMTVSREKVTQFKKWLDR